MTLTREQAVVTVRNVGQRYGYAVAVHGSGLRDIDLLAVPWVDKPAAPEFLVSELEEALPAVRTSEGEAKPHGRMAWALQLPAVGPPDIWYIDLSVMPVEAVSPEPREDCDARIGERRCRLGKGHEGYHDMPREGEQEERYRAVMDTHRKFVGASPPDHSVASVLRLTASRLRDPEYRWSVDPAVTLEHLAEKLEKVVDEARRSTAKLRARLEREDADG